MTHKLIPQLSAVDAGSIGLQRRSDIDYDDKFTGALLGVAVGDALGRPYERSRQTWFGVPPAELTVFKPWRGYQSGPVGTITDDTQMTICVAEWLLASEQPPAEQLSARFIDWLPEGRGVGTTCRTAVKNMIAGATWDLSGEPSAGNGAAMRIAPVGLRFSTDPASLVYFAALSTIPTHADPTAVISAIAQAFAVAYLVHVPPGSLDVAHFFQSLAQLLDGMPDPPRAERRRGGGEVSMGHRLAEVPGWLARPPAEAFKHFWNGAFVLESLPASWYSFFRAPEDPELAITTAIAGGYDSDTVASMAGALCGAYLGAGALPPAWTGDDLEHSQLLRDLARGLLAISSMP